MLIFKDSIHQIIWHLFCCTWLISHSLLSSWFIHVVRKDRISFFIGLNSILCCIYTIFSFSIHSHMETFTVYVPPKLMYWKVSPNVTVSEGGSSALLAFPLWAVWKHSFPPPEDTHSRHHPGIGICILNSHPPSALNLDSQPPELWETHFWSS
jgi:hypothetical protein